MPGMSASVCRSRVRRFDRIYVNSPIVELAGSRIATPRPSLGGGECDRDGECCGQNERGAGECEDDERAGGCQRRAKGGCAVGMVAERADGCGEVEDHEDCGCE